MALASVCACLLLTTLFPLPHPPPTPHPFAPNPSNPPPAALPAYLLGNVVQFLRLHDRLGVMAVCRSWRVELATCGALTGVDIAGYFQGFSSAWCGRAGGQGRQAGRQAGRRASGGGGREGGKKGALSACRGPALALPCGPAPPSVHTARTPHTPLAPLRCPSASAVKAWEASQACAVLRGVPPPPPPPPPNHFPKPAPLSSPG